MAVKLHRCSNVWVKLSGHPCWRVQKALEQAGVEYTLVPGPVRRSRRSALERLSGQRLYPVIEFEDGSIYREESAGMAERIRAGKLMGAHAGPPPSSPAGGDTGQSEGGDVAGAQAAEPTDAADGLVDGG